MIIIGEKINGAIPSVCAAIERRDEAFILDLADKQAEAGAAYLDICSGRAPELEKEDMIWLIDTVQSHTDMPLCVDSPNPHLLKELLPMVTQRGIVNSVSGEGDKMDELFPAISENGWDVIALTCDDGGIAAEANRKVEIAVRIIEKAASFGIAPERIYIDPLVLSLSAVNDSVINFLDAVKEIKRRYPGVKITSGLSNVSYGMPCRKAVNQFFLALAMYAGMDSAIADPANRDIYTAVLAVEALLGRDRFCRRYNRAYRAGRIGPVREGQEKSK